MAHKRKHASTARQRSAALATPKSQYADCLRQALDWFAKTDSFADLRLHGNVGWKAPQLVTLAVLWAWSDHRTLTGAFTHACRLALELFGNVAVTTYQGFTNALRSYTEQLLPQVWLRLHGLMEQSADEHWRVGKWLALAVDGTRVSTPRTQSNEQAFSIKNYGYGRKAKKRIKWKNKKKRTKKLGEPVKPQIWLTLIWHMGLKMPWSWKTGPSTAAERNHLREMLETQDFPENTLFCGDAGFVGYDFWTSIRERGHHFLMRVGGNVHLLRNLAYTRQKNNLVYVWPDAVLRRRQPPLVLRLLEFQGPRGKVYLVTSILSQRDLSLKQAQSLYRARWGIELQFRSYKQIFGRTKLRSRTAENALVELSWSLVGLSLLQLFATKEQIKLDSPPDQSSIALALDIIHEAVRNWSCEIPTNREFARRLGTATKDPYERHGTKKARYRPPSQDKPSATKPKIVVASRAQRQAYQQVRDAA